MHQLTRGAPGQLFCLRHTEIYYLAGFCRSGFPVLEVATFEYRDRLGRFRLTTPTSVVLTLGDHPIDDEYVRVLVGTEIMYVRRQLLIDYFDLEYVP